MSGVSPYHLFCLASQLTVKPLQSPWRASPNQVIMSEPLESVGSECLDTDFFFLRAQLCQF